jgi:gamma-glutamyltranspeptidase
MSETVVGEKGMVVAPHRAAAEAGAEILRAGGNAIEATIAAAATIAVVYPHLNGLGGDAFWLIAEPGRPPRAIDASGAAGSLATRERYEEKGYDRIPERGPDAALTVAGAVSGWALAAEIAGALGGRLPRGDLLADAIGRAKDGTPTSGSLARATARHLAELAPVPGFASHFLVAGKAPLEGAVLKQPRLADTLDQLARAGFDDFYRGDIAGEISADLDAVRSPVTRADLEKHAARLATPLSVELADATVFNTPPPTQGLASLILLGLFDRLGVKRGESFEHIHGLIEAAKHAYAVRNAEVTDPADAGDVAEFLQPAWLDARVQMIDGRRAGLFSRAVASGDTVWLGAIDRRGLAVSFIQSLYFGFGSGVVLPRTGIVWHNRGAAFSLDPEAKNPLEPGRKPFHTLNPPLARFRDGRTFCYGTSGGDRQPLVQAEIFTRYARFAMTLGEATDAPRLVLSPKPGLARGEITMESRFDPDLVTALASAGHEIRVLPEAYVEGMGHAGALVRRADGRLFGASDPRSDGAAVAA